MYRNVGGVGGGGHWWGRELRKEGHVYRYVEEGGGERWEIGGGRGLRSYRDV